MRSVEAPVTTPADPLHRGPRATTSGSPWARALIHGLRRRVAGVVEPLAMRRYATASRYGPLVVADRARRGSSPVLVYTVGKVASTTVVASLAQAGIRPVYHVHVLTPSTIAGVRDVYRRAWSQLAPGWHLWESLYLRRQLDRSPGTCWRVVTLVRDPVARNLSSFFQVGESEYGVDFSSLARAPRGEALAARLLDEFLHRFRGHDAPDTFFDEELLPVFGIDVYAAPFPVEQAYHVYAGPRADALVLRVEDLDRCFSTAVAQFLGVPDIPLARVNASEDKDYGELYAWFRRAVTLPDEYLDRVYSSRYARHFYSDEEIRRMRARWAREGAAPAEGAGERS